jgi:hypothetical protein
VYVSPYLFILAKLEQSLGHREQGRNVLLVERQRQKELRGCSDLRSSGVSESPTQVGLEVEVPRCEPQWQASTPGTRAIRPAHPQAAVPQRQDKPVSIGSEGGRGEERKKAYAIGYVRTALQRVGDGAIVREGSFVVALREGRLRRDVFNRQPRNVVRIYNDGLRTAKVALAQQGDNVWRSNFIAPVTFAVGFCLYDVQGSVAKREWPDDMC